MCDTLSIKRGDQFTKEIVFTDNIGEPIDITWCTVYFTIREEGSVWDNDDTNALIQKDVTSHTDAVNGKTSVFLSSTDTDQDIWSYLWEVQIKFPNNDIRSTDTATVNIVQDLTKRN